MKTVEIVVLVALLLSSVFSTVYYRKAIKKIDEDKNNTDIEDLISDVDEIKMNVKKIMGNAYKAV